MQIHALFFLYSVLCICFEIYNIETSAILLLFIITVIFFFFFLFFLLKAFSVFWYIYFSCVQHMLMKRGQEDKWSNLLVGMILRMISLLMTNMVVTKTGPLSQKLVRFLIPKKVV